jgi:hypothetical protein
VYLSNKHVLFSYPVFPNLWFNLGLLALVLKNLNTWRDSLLGVLLSLPVFTVLKKVTFPMYEYTGSKICLFVLQFGSMFFLCGGFFGFLMFFIQHCLICRASDSTVSEDAGTEPRIVATLALAVRRSNHSAGSHPIYWSMFECQWRSYWTPSWILLQKPQRNVLCLYIACRTIRTPGKSSIFSLSLAKHRMSFVANHYGYSQHFGLKHWPPCM